jgi:hypothetical protein
MTHLVALAYMVHLVVRKGTRCQRDHMEGLAWRARPPGCLPLKAILGVRFRAFNQGHGWKDPWIGKGP